MKTWVKFAVGGAALYAAGGAVTAVLQKRAFPAAGPKDLLFGALEWPFTLRNVLAEKKRDLSAAAGAPVSNAAQPRFTQAGAGVGINDVKNPTLVPSLSDRLSPSMRADLVNTNPALRGFF